MPDLTGHFKVRVPKGVNIDTAMADFANDPKLNVWKKSAFIRLYHAQRHLLFRPVASRSHRAASTRTWPGKGSRAIQTSSWRFWTQVFTITIPTSGLTSGRIQGEIPNNGIDDDGNGYIDDTTAMTLWNRPPEPLCSRAVTQTAVTDDNDPSITTATARTLRALLLPSQTMASVSRELRVVSVTVCRNRPRNGVRIMPLRVGWNGALLGLLCGNGLIRMDYAAEALHYVAAAKSGRRQCRRSELFVGIFRQWRIRCRCG